jgi:hypothetical protein
MFWLAGRTCLTSKMLFKPFPNSLALEVVGQLPKI